MRALAWEFPHDPSLAAADRQFFLGPAVRTYFRRPRLPFCIMFCVSRLVMGPSVV